MLREVKIQGPACDIDAVIAVGQGEVMFFGDSFLDQDDNYSALITSFDDEQYRADEVLAQVQTLLAQEGADFDRFFISENYVYFPDAMPYRWYEAISCDFVHPLQQLEYLGVRTPEQQIIMDWARGEIKSRVSAACEVAEFNIEEFMASINKLLS